jgi:hypothetical protein
VPEDRATVDQEVEVNKQEAALAYKAGRRATSIVWPEDTPDEIRKPGTHHCPFPEGDPQRAEWLRGYSDSMQEQAPPPTLIKQINDEIGVTADVR